jgi:hypothetical protein
MMAIMALWRRRGGTHEVVSGVRMTVQEYLGNVAAQLVYELQPILQIKEVTANSELLGQYAEASVRRLARRVVQPMRVSTGAVLDYPMPPSLKQLDVVIWAPFPAPAIFEVEDFALVPRSSAFGVIEIKRSNYNKAVSELQSFLEDPDTAKLVSEPWPGVEDNRSAVIGVIGVLEKKPSSKLQALLNAKKVIAVLNKSGQQAEARTNDVLILVNFLYYISWRYHFRVAQPSVPQLRTDVIP